VMNFLPVSGCWRSVAVESTGRCQAYRLHSWRLPSSSLHRGPCGFLQALSSRNSIQLRIAPIARARLRTNISRKFFISRFDDAKEKCKAQIIQYSSALCFRHGRLQTRSTCNGIDQPADPETFRTAAFLEQCDSCGA